MTGKAIPDDPKYNRGWLFRFQGLRVELIPGHCSRFDAGLYPPISVQAGHDGAIAPAGKPAREPGVADGPGRVPSVGGEGDLNGQITGFARPVRGLHNQVGPAEASQFVCGNVRRVLGLDEGSDVRLIQGPPA